MAELKYNPLLKLNLQEMQDIPEPPEPITVDDELSPTSTNPVQNKVITNKIEEITSDSIDIDVSTLSEFVAAVERSAEVSVRIHLRADISLAENLTVNLDNCQVYGHDNRIFLENHTFLIQGEYCYFYQVRFNASSLVTAQTANQSDYFDARIKIVSTKASTRFFFEYVIFMNFVCHSFDKQHTIIEVDTTSSGSPSLHTYFLYCEVMTNYLGNNLPRINDCVWSLENVGNSLHCITAHIIDYWGVGFDGTNYDSTKNFNFSGNTLKGFAKLGFTSDASINYAASPSGYTSLTPNAVNIYNPSSTEFKALYNYVHGNNFATAAQGTKADNALQSIGKGTDGDYIDTTVTPKNNNAQTVAASLTIQDITSTDNDHRGLLEALNTRNYIDTQIYKVSLNFFFYGVQWDENDPSPDCTRIGNMSLHAELPIQNSIIGGLLQDDLTFTPFADQSDWSAETVDGSAGQVMVQIPKHYVKFETHGTINKVLMSEYPLVGFTQVPMFYISAFKAALDRTNPNTPKLCSVVNMSPEFRGGDNTADWDNTYRSLLGKPTSNINLTNFRQYARNRAAGTAWNCHTYLAQRMLYWLFVTEYATLHTQKPFNAAKDANGYMQGGLGPGVSTWTGEAWANYNSYNPLIPCGYLLEYGNTTSIKNYDIKDAANNILTTFEVNSYHGIQSPFGDIWDWTDGVLFDTQTGGNGITTAYYTDNPANFSSVDLSQYTVIGTMPRSNSWIRNIFYDEKGSVMCEQLGGNSTSYYCGYFWGGNIPSSDMICGCLFGATAYHGTRCALISAYINEGPSHISERLGTRLVAIPTQQQ
ncbi:MAG: hypothetical protein J6T33_08140 [Bacteroidales bacterium]|nr:hypothetical protein [Bacteroidales bacterium]MBO7541612.1 hypothetical protein [Bacteroidales bacterium]